MIRRGKIRTDDDAERAHDLVFQVAAVAFLVASGMAFGIWVGPAMFGTHAWMIPGDIWVTQRAAHIIAWGGEGILYQHSYGYITFPGAAVVLAPVAMLSSALHLSESFPFSLPHPTAWFILGPSEIALGSFVLFPLAAIARRLDVPRARRLVLLALEVAVIWPATVLWGHPEDLVALGFGLYALMRARAGQWKKSAVLMGLAILFQPLAVLLIPLAGAYIPWRKWLSAASVAIAPSILLLATPLIHTFRTTLHNLVDQPTSPTVMHPTPWLALAPVIRPGYTGLLGRWRKTGLGITFVNHSTHFSASVAGGPSRLFAIFGAVAIGLFVARRRPSEPVLYWCAALSLSLRCVFESVTVEYYAIPTLAIALVIGANASRVRFALVAISASACTVLSYFHLAPWAYYLPVTATLLGAVLLGLPRGAELMSAAGTAGHGDPGGIGSSRSVGELDRKPVAVAPA